MVRELFNADVTARKVHKCDLCGLMIAAGAKHRLLKMKDGGDFFSSRYHAHCDQVTKIDGWDEMDWEVIPDPADFRVRLEELAAVGQVVLPLQEPHDGKVS